MDIIYQVLPRLYDNRDGLNVCNGTIDQNGCGKFAYFTDRKLQEIKSLGCSYIWYTGILEHSTLTDYSEIGMSADSPDIVKGIAGSPYAIRDYYSVDPDLAIEPINRMKEFYDLIERTHNSGLKVIIDFVPNHVARSYRSKMKPLGVKDLGEDDNAKVTFDRDNNFYYLVDRSYLSPSIVNNENHFFEFPAKVTGNDCYRPDPSENDWYETVKINYGIDYLNGDESHFSPIPDTWNKMCNILHFWTKFGVDGFRCDMAGMVPVEFWNYAISYIKNRFSNTIFIAELYEPEKYKSYLEVGGFDYLYDKVGMYDYIRAVISGRAAASGITNCWQSVDRFQDKMLYFLENHDEQRVASEFFAGDPFKAIPALAVLLLLNRAPFLLYFGQELGERGMDNEGYSGRDGRTSIFDYYSPKCYSMAVSDCERSRRELLNKKYSQYMNMALKDKVFSDGVTYDLEYANPKSDHFDPFCHYVFLRKYEGSCRLILANFSGVDSIVRVIIPKHAIDFLQIGGCQNFSIDGDTEIYVHVNGYDAAVVEIL